MKGTRAAIRYAKSLLDLALEQKLEDKVKEDMSMIAETVSQNRDLELLLKSPIINKEQKLSVLTKIFAGNMTDLSNSFVKMIVDNNREEILGAIAASYINEYKTHKNIASAEVITAIPMTKEFKQKVEKLIQASENRTIELTETVNADIIGGLIIKIGDKQIDSSISRRISDLKQTFNNNPQVAES